MKSIEVYFYQDNQCQNIDSTYLWWFFSYIYPNWKARNQIPTTVQSVDYPSEFYSTIYLLMMAGF